MTSLGSPGSALPPPKQHLGKDEEELSPHMSSFRYAMTQISELEEKAVEELRELRQVRGGVRCR